MRSLEKTMERVKGIEPSYSAWKAAALPLSYTRGRLFYANPHRTWQWLIGEGAGSLGHFD